jgi:type I restriction enzyme R subunit
LRDALATYTDRDKKGRAVGEDVRQSAIPEMMTEHNVVCDLLHGVDWVTILHGGSTRAFVSAIGATAEHLQESERNLVDDDTDPGEFDVDQPEEPSLKRRFMAHTLRLKRLFTLVPTSPEAAAIREDVAFFDAVRQNLSKPRDIGSDGEAALDTAVRQIVSEHMTGTGVIDIFAEAGLAKPDISLIDDDFLAKFEESDTKNLQLEAVRRLIDKEVKVVAKRNVVAGRQFSQMLSETLRRYQNRTIDAAQVMIELAEIARLMDAQRRRGEETGMTDDELAFYDAMLTNESARAAMKDPDLRAIAHQLAEIVRKDAKTDWQLKEQVRAKLRTDVKRLLLRSGYPPDHATDAADLILKQAEVMAENNQ